MKQEDTKQGNQQKMQKETPHMSGNPAQPDVQQKQEYEQYVKSVTPTHNLWAQMGKAFLTGGIICCIGQFILNTCENYGLDKDKCRINIASLLGSSGRNVLSLRN